MENANDSAAAGGKAVDENPNPNPPATGEADQDPAASPPRRPPRAPFTSLSQVDADLALARALQEQERAYMMLRMNGGDGSDYASSEAESYVDEDEEEEEDEELEGADPDHPIEDEESAEGSDYGEDAFDANDRPLDPAEFDSDEAYARALQEAEEHEVAARLMALTGLNDWRVEDHGDHGSNSQERAYMMLRMNDGDGSDYASSEAESYVDEDEEEEEDEELERADLDHPIEDEESAEGSDYGEDAFDANDRPLDPAEFDSDEAYARALQEAEEHEVAARLMALTGLNDWRVKDHGDHGSNSQDAWEDVDPDELSYEELIALGEVVGTESRGLSADTIASLTSINYKAQSVQDGNTDQCVICRLDYEDGDSLVVLSCKHTYHPECINKWLQINKVCPVCSSEVSTSERKED